MKTHELRDLSKDDLLTKEKTLKKELFDLHYQKKFGRVDKPGRFKSIRRMIARIETILRQKDKTDNGPKK